MRDFVKEMLDTLSKQGDQIAYDLGVELLLEIEAERERLNNQASAIVALRRYLQDIGKAVDPETDPYPPLKKIDPVARSREIIQTAHDVWEAQQREYSPWDREAMLIKVQDVLERLTSKGLDLGVQQPLAVIGTVLSGATDFTRVARNIFEYIPEPDFER